MTFVSILGLGVVLVAPGFIFFLLFPQFIKVCNSTPYRLLKEIVFTMRRKPI